MVAVLRTDKSALHAILSLCLISMSAAADFHSELLDSFFHQSALLANSSSLSEVLRVKSDRVTCSVVLDNWTPFRFKYVAHSVPSASTVEAKAAAPPRTMPPKSRGLAMKTSGPIRSTGMIGYKLLDERDGALVNHLSIAWDNAEESQANRLSATAFIKIMILHLAGSLARARILHSARNLH